MKEPDISISEYTLSYQWNLEEKKFKKYKANDIFDLFADMPTTTNAMASNMSVLGEITQTTNNTSLVGNNNKRRRVDNAINNLININSKASKANRRSVR